MLTTQQLKQSLEADYLRHASIRYTVGAVLLVITDVILLFNPKWQTGALSLMPLLCVGLTLAFAGLACYAYLEYRALFRRAEHYRIYTARLTDPTSAMGLLQGAKRFTAVFTDESGEEIARYTAARWTNSMMSPFYYGELCEQTVQVAYCAETGRLIVLQRTDAPSPDAN